MDSLSAEATEAVPLPTGFPTLGDGRTQVERAASGYDIPGQISTKYPHTARDNVYPVPTNRRRVLLQCLGMRHVSKGISAESQHARR